MASITRTGCMVRECAWLVPMRGCAALRMCAPWSVKNDKTEGDGKRAGAAMGASAGIEAADAAAGGVDRGNRTAALLRDSVLAAVAYFVLGALTDLFFRSQGLLPAPLWPAASVAVVAAMALGWRAGAGIVLGSLAVNMVILGLPVVQAGAVSLANAAGAVAGMAVASRLAGRLTPLPGLRATFGFAVGAIGVHAAITAAGGAATLVASGLVPADRMLVVFLRWWLADAGGTLLLAPTVLLWMLDRGIGSARESRGEFFLVAAVTLVGGAVLFTGVRFAAQWAAALPFLLLVLLAWAAMRFRLRDAYALFGILAAMTLVGTAMGHGPFAAPGIERPMIFAGVFVVTTALTILSCGAQANDRRRAEHRLRAMVGTLEHMVAERTAELKEREGQLRLILEDAPIPLFVTSLRGHRLLFLNDRAERLLGAPREAMLGVYAPDYWIDPDQRRLLLETLERDGHASDLEVGFRRAEGPPFVALLSASRTVFDGEPAMVVGINDITDRKRAEDAVRESERKMRILADNMTDVVWSVDAGLRYTYISPSVERLRGFNVAEMLGHHIREGLTPESYATARRMIDAACRAAGRGEVLGAVEMRMELRHPCRDGSIADSEVCASVLFDAEGRLAGLQGVTRNISERKRLERELHRLAIMDCLTELPNRRHFLERLEAEIERSTRYDRPLSVAMIDLDHFKAINDTHGHAAGDEALRRFAATCRDALRASDVIGRLGGEEFAVVLPETALADAALVTERLREVVGALRIGDADDAFSFTVSVGIAELRPGDDASRLLCHADKALYAAKRQGRNRVVAEMAEMAEAAANPT